MSKPIIKPVDTVPPPPRTTVPPPSGTAVAPSGTAVAPSGTAVAPSGTAIAPSGTAVAAGTAVAPSGTAVAAGTAVKNDPDGQSPQQEPQEQFAQFVINGVSYGVVRLISDQSGEARMFQVTAGGRNYALKLYRYKRHPDTAVLNAVKNAPRGNGLLIDLYDFGIWASPMSGKQYDYELMPYYEGGSLADVRPLRNDKDGREKLKKIAIRMATEIAYCHERRVLHRDIKPANFLYDGTDMMNFVLTDFGIGKMIGPDGIAIIDVGRTPIYAAPEMYTQIPGRPLSVTPAADFYSMGMALMALWMGESVLTADEGKLVKDKQLMTLPYPQRKEIGDELLSLIRALTRFDESKRATFADIERWAKGEDVFKEEEPQTAFSIAFSSTETAHSPEELAEIMWDPKNRTLAKQYLYKDQIKNWLYELKRSELAVRISVITEDEYPDSRDAGLFAACLLLDEDMTYTGLSGNKVETSEDIAAELTQNEQAYAKQLASPDHQLWVYMRSRDGQDVASQYPGFIKDRGVRAVRQLTYALDPRLPYRVEASGHSYVIRSLEDLFKTLNQINPAYLVRELTEEDFLEWYSNRDPVMSLELVDIMLESGLDMNSMQMGWLVAYSIGSAYGYDFAPLTGKYPSPMGTIEQLGRQMAKEINDNDMGPGSLAGMLKDSIFTESRLFYYLYTRKKYDKQIKWIRYCLDINSDDNQKKAGPYTDLMARMKAVAGLLGNKFPLQIDKYVVSTLAEYQNNKSKIDNKAKGRNAELLQDWLALQYQENPAADLSGGRYTKLASDYLKCLMQNLPSCSPASLALATKRKIDDAKSRYHSAASKVTIMKSLVVLLGYLPLIAVCGFIIWNLVFNIESESFRGTMESIGNIMGWIVGIGGGLALCAANPIVGILGGIGLYYLTGWLIGLLTPLVPWLLVAILAGILFVFTAVLFDSNTSTKLNDTWSSGSDLDEAAERACLADGFQCRDKLMPGLPDDYPACVYNNTASSIETGLSLKKWHALIMIIVAAVVMGLYYWATGGNILSGGGGSASVTQVDYPHAVGIFSGQFDGRTATMTLREGGAAGTVEGTIVINYRKQLTHQVKGSYDYNNHDRLVLYVLDSDGSINNNIYYTGSMAPFDSGIYEYSGQYFNNTKGSKHDFYFTQQE